MSTTVTVAVAAPNHLPVDVFVQNLARSGRKEAVWVNVSQYGKKLKVGEAATFSVYNNQRLIIEESEED